MTIPKRFRLFALGSNGSGQLGIGSLEDVAEPVECQFDAQALESIDIKDTIVKIAAGGNHTFVLLKSGLLFASGSNEHGQCFGPAEVEETTNFRRVVIPVGVAGAQLTDVTHFTDVSTTWEASFLLDTTGVVHVIGMGSKGELGLGSKSLNEPQSGFLDIKEPRLSNLYSSMRHTVAICEDGKVYGWGSCRKGELGEQLIDRKIQSTPIRLSVPFECRKALVGRNFTILIGDEACEVFGQVGDLEKIVDVEGLASKEVDAGWSTVYALIGKHLKAFGRNDRGQWPSENLPGLKKLAAGSEHCVGLTTDRQVVAWGWGEHGNCGMPTDHRGNVAGKWNVLLTQLHAGEEIINVAAGCATSFLIVDAPS